MTDKEKILQGIEKWAKVMLKTGALEKTQSLSSDSWYDADEIVCSIRGYIKNAGVDLWGGDILEGKINKPTKEQLRIKLLEWHADYMVDVEFRKRKKGYGADCSDLHKNFTNKIYNFLRERLDTFCGMPVNDKFYVEKYIPSDETIIKECLNYIVHRIKNHPNSYASRAFENWLPRIGEMRRKKIIGLLHEDCLNKSKKEEPKKIERINRKEWFDNYGNIARLRMLIEKQDEIINYIND